jgi:FlaA1/EpsC-like NDP-sugar epimerase
MANVRGQTKRIAIIGTSSWATQLAEDLRKKFSADQMVVGYISECLFLEEYWEFELDAPLLGHLKQVKSIITNHNIDLIYLVISPESHHKISSNLLDLTQSNVMVRVISAAPHLMTDKVNYKQPKRELPLLGLTEPTGVKIN